MAEPMPPGCMPLPAHVHSAEPLLRLWPRRLQLTSQHPKSARLERAVLRFNQRLQRLRSQADTPLAAGIEMALEVTVAQTAAAVPQLHDDEAYELHISHRSIVLRAANDWGALHGLETLSQLLSENGALTVAEVSDQPRFAWRGLLLDVARHFLSLEVLKRTIDCMAAVKLNVLHLHLSDDQGFRFRSERFPKLASAQSYSQTQLAELVDFAADRAIRVVPELDMPGHVTSWLLAYPEWGTEPVTASDRFGVHSAALNPADDNVYAAIDALLGELAMVFPDRCVHIGGDEVHPQWWQRSAQVQAHMRRHKLADVAALQAQFNTRVRDLLTTHGRQMLAWDEALHPGIAPTDAAAPVLIQNWRGATSRDRALAAGHPCIVSSGYYLDLHYPAAWHYLFDPAGAQQALIAHEDTLLERADYAQVADGMRWTHQWRAEAISEPPQVATAILGGEACLWGELVDEETLDVRLWTRLPALAERFWSSPWLRDCEAMYQRTDTLLAGWARCGRNDIPSRSATGLQAAGVNAHWQALLAWFEPVKWYGRLLGQQALRARLAGTEMPKARPYTALTALNQPIDHLPVESQASRSLGVAMAAGDLEAVQRVADSWQSIVSGNDCPALLIEQRSALQALHSLVQQRLTGEKLNQQQLELVDDLKKPNADLLLAPVFVLEQWLCTSEQ